MAWPNDVGILALELYYPKLFVDQKKLEEYDKVSTGKYTIGLGQQSMAVCSDLEDVQSMCLTVTSNLLNNNKVDVRSIGRLEVGTESRIDRSKSIKSTLMSLFVDNVDMEGVDSTNACFGGTQALFNAVNWVESSSCQGRLALVVMGDISVYAPGPARPTGGAGALAMLVGPNAPIVLERGLRAIVMKHTYDFFKPDPKSNYPVVNGKDSTNTYIQCLQDSYSSYKQKAAKLGDCAIDLNSFDALLFHSPFTKLVTKAVSRMAFVDFKEAKKTSTHNDLEQFRDYPLSTPLEDRALLDAFVKQSSDTYKRTAHASLHMARHVGNMYTPSLYGGLVSFLLSGPVCELVNKRIGLYSYGSGAASAFFSLRLTSRVEELGKVVYGIRDAHMRLEERTEITPEMFTEIMKIRESLIGKVNFVPSYEVNEQNLFPGTFYLLQVNENHVRKYAKFDSKIEWKLDNNNEPNGVHTNGFNVS